MQAKAKTNNQIEHFMSSNNLTFLELSLVTQTRFTCYTDKNNAANLVYKPSLMFA